MFRVVLKMQFDKLIIGLQINRLNHRTGTIIERTNWKGSEPEPERGTVIFVKVSSGTGTAVNRERCILFGRNDRNSKITKILKILVSEPINLRFDKKYFEVSHFCHKISKISLNFHRFFEEYVVFCHLWGKINELFRSERNLKRTRNGRFFYVGTKNGTRNVRYLRIGTKERNVPTFRNRSVRSFIVPG